MSETIDLLPGSDRYDASPAAMERLTSWIEAKVRLRMACNVSVDGDGLARLTQPLPASATK